MPPARVPGFVTSGEALRRAPLPEVLIMLERIEQAGQPGTPVVFRRRVLAEAADFIRRHHGDALNTVTTEGGLS